MSVGSDSAQREPSRPRSATRDDAAALAATMARAFQDDPFVSYLVPGDARRMRKLPDMFGLFSNSAAHSAAAM
jgi:hypothetical protein